MTTKKILNTLLVSVLLLTLSFNPVFSQDKMERKDKRERKEMVREKHQRTEIPNLTDKQKADLKEIRISFAKENKELRNELKELKVHLNSLKTSNKIVMDKISAQIDLINTKRTILEKKQAIMEQEIRNLLDDEQKLFYDKHMNRNNRSERSIPAKHHK